MLARFRRFAEPTVVGDVDEEVSPTLLDKFPGMAAKGIFEADRGSDLDPGILEDKRAVVFPGAEIPRDKRSRYPAEWREDIAEGHVLAEGDEVGFVVELALVDGIVPEEGDAIVEVGFADGDICPEEEVVVAGAEVLREEAEIEMHVERHGQDGFGPDDEIEIRHRGDVGRGEGFEGFEDSLGLCAIPFFVLGNVGLDDEGAEVAGRAKICLELTDAVEDLAYDEGGDEGEVGMGT